MPGMGQRDDQVLRYVAAYCPHCHHEDPERPPGRVRRLGGYLSAAADGRVWLVRGCPEHGMVRTLYDESAEILAYLEQWAPPTVRHAPGLFGSFDPLPQAHLRGPGEPQTRHTCSLLEDSELGYSLCCPSCFAPSSPQLRSVTPAAQVLASIDARLARQNGPIDALMLSSGEPAIHPELIRLLDAIMERPIARVLINTSGIEIAQDDALLACLKKHRGRVEVYLWFDGFGLEARRYHRGAGLRRVKEQAIQRLSAAGVFMTLSMTAALGVNDDEIGAVLVHALNTPFVGGVCIQPSFGGPAAPIDRADRLTHTGALARFGPQTGGLITWRDMTALPRSHPHCCSVGYMVHTDGAGWRSLAAIIGHEQLKAHLGLMSSGSAAPEPAAQPRALVGEALLGLLGERSSLAQPQAGDLFRTICESYDIGLSTLPLLAGPSALGRRDQLRELLARRVKRIMVKPFTDINTITEERLLQCCVRVGARGEDGARPAIAR